MPANTPNLALPYPVSADTVDVPRDIQALATKLDVVPGTNLPLYTETTLPISAPAGTMAWFIYSAAPGGAAIYSIRFSGDPGGAWYTFGQIPMLDTGDVTPTTLTAATGWRKTSLSVTMSMRGSYLFSAASVQIYNVAETQGGIGLASQGVADTATPPYQTNQAQSAASSRVGTIVSEVRATCQAGDVMSLRANSVASATITFARARIWAVPLSLYGVA